MKNQILLFLEQYPKIQLLIWFLKQITHNSLDFNF